MTPASRPIPILIAGALILAACGHSPPSRFFTLDAAPPAHPARTQAPVAPVQLDAVHIPAAVDRLEMVTETGPARVQISGQDRWAAPLGEMMRRTLAQDLASRLPRGAFVFPEAPRPQGTRGLVITVLQLKASPDGRVALQANWSLLDSGSSRAAGGDNLSLSAAGGPGAQGQAQALSAVLGQLADRIAGALQRG
jgi:uncharacterized lipoprotein YmbA